jgi:5-methylcytosine-specific restriction protein B
MSDYEKFKKLLALFVAHLEAIEAGKDSIAPLNKKCNALKTEFSETQYGDILVNVSNQFNYGFTTKTCYLEWERGSGVNVNCVWNSGKTKIEKLQLQQCINGGQSQGEFEDPEMQVKVSDLDLYSPNPPNSTLKNFFDNYCRMYRPQMFNNMNIVNLLEKSKNLILTGAPGVGKTYKTAEIAVAIADGADKVPADRKNLMKRYKELTECGQIAFTTFHQSLDYEEFVEGLKPEIDDDDNSTGNFSVKEGIFKSICEKAKGNFDNSQKTQEQLNKESNLINFVEDFLNDAIDNNKEFETTFWKIKYYVEEFEKGKIKIRHGNYSTVETKPKNEFVTIDFKELISLLQNQEKIADKKAVAETLKRKIIHPRDNYFYSIYSEIFEALQQNNNQHVQSKKFVLIIDEINRGNISKIFGELITLLEKDKLSGADNENEIQRKNRRKRIIKNMIKKFVHFGLI